MTPAPAAKLMQSSEDGRVLTLRCGVVRPPGRMCATVLCDLVLLPWRLMPEDLRGEYRDEPFFEAAKRDESRVRGRRVAGHGGEIVWHLRCPCGAEHRISRSRARAYFESISWSPVPSKSPTRYRHEFVTVAEMLRSA